MPQTCKGAVDAQVAMGRFDAVADPRSDFYHCLVAADPSHRAHRRRQS